jgi:hypothetical protein
MLFHKSDSLDIVIWQDLREHGQPAFVDQAVPEQLENEREWPILTPAGIEPEPDIEEQTHRPHV